MYNKNPWYYFGPCTPEPKQMEKGHSPHPPYKVFATKEDADVFIKKNKGKPIIFRPGTFMTMIALALMLVALPGCKKEITQGPQGPPGLNGAQGAVAYDLDFSIAPSDWFQAGTSGTPGAGVIVNLQNINLSNDSINGGVVMVYRRDYTTYEALPWILFSNGYQFNFQYSSYDGGVSIYVYNSVYTFTTFGSNEDFRVIVIPGAHKTVPIDITDYRAVMKYYHPKLIH